MDTRSATSDDLAAITALQGRFDTAWFGAPQLDADEMRETFDAVADLAADTRLFFDGGALVAATWRAESLGTVVIDPAHDDDALRSAVIDWLAGAALTRVEVLHGDDALRRALGDRGWRHVHSAFELLRPVAPDWVIDAPTWPEGVELRPYDDARAADVHHLIYVDAEWASITGHQAREYDDWYRIFLAPATKPEPPLVAWRGDRMVGVALGRIFADGTGWISQLAVRPEERGHGLGRALLRATLRSRRDAGAATLGLAVQADNRGALQMYLEVGLVIDREWLDYAPPE